MATAASGGAVALAYAREGAEVVLSYLSEDSDAQDTVAVVEAAGRRTLAIPATIPAEQASRFAEGSEMGQPAQPAELAPIYVFSASDDASDIHGQIIGVMGGVPLT